MGYWTEKGFACLCAFVLLMPLALYADRCTEETALKLQINNFLAQYLSPLPSPGTQGVVNLRETYRSILNTFKSDPSIAPGEAWQNLRFNRVFREFYARYRVDDLEAFAIANFVKHTDSGGFSKYFDPLYKEFKYLPEHLPQTIGDPNSKRSALSLFSADFRVLPIEFFSHSFMRAGIPEGANLFAMFVPDLDIQIKRLINELERKKENLATGFHLPKAFAYIRFYINQRGVFITEIQSDMFKLIRDSIALSKRYENWARVIVLAFEEHVERTIFARRKDILPHIYVAGENYQLRRWPSINAGLVRVLYRQLPKDLGYRSVSEILEAYEWLDSPEEHLKPTEERQTIPIHEGWRRSRLENTDTLDGKPGFSAVREEFRLLLEESKPARIDGKRRANFYDVFFQPKMFEFLKRCSEQARF